jgi:uncharacterized repeat protein (TIGR03803 family)
MKTRLLLFALMLPALAAAQTYTYSTFLNFPATGGPFGAGQLIIDAQGNLYASSPYGGIYSSNDNGGDGTVDMVTPAGGLKVLYNFGSTPTDGIRPVGPLTRDAAGNLYGTTGNGGANGAGTVFKLTPQGVETTLTSFPNNDQGLYTTAGGGVTLDGEGNLYGYVTRWSGFYADGGDIFKLTPEGVYSIIYDWCPGGECTRAEGPTGTLVRNPTGGFFGATGGNYTPSGNVFALSAQNTIDVLYTFPSPLGAKTNPVLDAAGNLFGVAGEPFGAGSGIVYEINADGDESTVYTLPTRYGYNGYGPPILDADGNLYDTTEINAPLDIVFKVSPAGVETVLYMGQSVDPTGLVMDNAGNLYTTCFFCGINHTGSIGKLTKNAE